MDELWKDYIILVIIAIGGFFSLKFTAFKEVEELLSLYINKYTERKNTLLETLLLSKTTQDDSNKHSFVQFLIDYDPTENNKVKEKQYLDLFEKAGYNYNYPDYYSIIEIRSLNDKINKVHSSQMFIGKLQFFFVLIILALLISLFL